MSDNLNAYAFAYQPIVNADQASVAVELHYRAVPGAEDNPALAAANAIINAFIHSGLDDLLRHRKAFVPVSRDLLDSELLKLLPAGHVALELPAAELCDSLCHERCRELKALGYTLVLDGIDQGDPPLPLFDVFDIVAFDGQAAAEGRVAATLDRLRPFEVRRLVRRVDTPDLYQALRHAGFELFQGYYFARRSEATGHRANPQKLALIDIIARLEDDQDDRTIEEAFKHDPGLALHLLRLVNSPAFVQQRKISSIKHAIITLGRAQLTRWLQVLLFALDGGGATSPLMELALRRARFMEFVVTGRTHQASSRLQEEAYMVGLLSLADVLMDWPVAKVAERLNLVEDVKQALVARQGVLGRLLDLCEALEQAEFLTVETIAAELQLPLDAVMSAQNTALAWAHAFMPSADAPDRASY
jgi:EAL and modified HD-GYP domain-containing signal transduction protein